MRFGYLEGIPFADDCSVGDTPQTSNSATPNFPTDPKSQLLIPKFFSWAGVFGSLDLEVGRQLGVGRWEFDLCRAKLYSEHAQCRIVCRGDHARDAVASGPAPPATQAAASARAEARAGGGQVPGGARHRREDEGQLLFRARGARSGGGRAREHPAPYRRGDADVRSAQPSYVFRGGNKDG